MLTGTPCGPAYGRCHRSGRGGSILGYPVPNPDGDDQLVQVTDAEVESLHSCLRPRKHRWLTRFFDGGRVIHF